MSETEAPSYYLLRDYRSRGASDTDQSAAERTLLDSYLQDALIPAAKRRGIGPIGVFSNWIGEQNFGRRTVLMAGQDLALLADLDNNLLTDPAFEEASRPFRNEAPISSKSSLLKAMPTLPLLVMPPELVGSPNRMFELRNYAQPTDTAHRIKAEMFVEGEAAVLDSCGFHGIMYASVIAGEPLQSLYYIWAYDNLEQRRQAEATFFADPKAREFMGQPRFRVSSTISNEVLRPLPYSDV